MPRRTKHPEQSWKKNESENIPKLEKLSFKNKYSWDNAEEWELIYNLCPSDPRKFKGKVMVRTGNGAS